MLIKPSFFILTGGPGAGKTTVLEELARREYPTVPEVARSLIQEQALTGGDALPWSNRERYAMLMLERSIQSFRETQETGITFCDRGIPDTLCYCRLVGLDDRETVEACRTFRYGSKAFLAPPWEAIYTTDAERKQDFQEAVRTSELMASVYRDCGYEVVELPFTSPVARADFILDHIRLNEAKPGLASPRLTF